MVCLSIRHDDGGSFTSYQSQGPGNCAVKPAPCDLACLIETSPTLKNEYVATGPGGEEKRESLVSDEARQKLHDTPELDYLTHLVFRMYENKRCGIRSYFPVMIWTCRLCFSLCADWR